MKNLFLLLILLIAHHGIIFSQGCLPEGIIFVRQAQIDSFAIIYPGCIRIEGDMTIGDVYGTNIKNLTGLSSLNAIEGSLIIGGNDSLVSLDGLNNLDTIGQNFQLYILDQDPYYIAFFGNHTLSSLSGLENLEYIGGDLGIIDNVQLSVCELDCFCDYMSNPNGIVDIQGNGPGCNSVVELATQCGNSLQCLPYGNYFLSTQADVDNFQSSFPGCTELHGDLTLFGIDGITNLDGLNDLVSIGGSVSIFNCVGLTDLSGFENLTFIGKHLLVEYNELQNISGLENITTVDGGIIILGNENLTSLSGLDNINAASINNLMIWDNINLSTCAVTSICDYLAAPNGDIFIQENATGCNNQLEVQTACEVEIAEPVAGGQQSAVIIFPNPASDQITIQTSSSEKYTAGATIALHSDGLISIFNLDGQELIRQHITETNQVIDISHLASGIYFVKLTNENTVQVLKIMKE